ncbi:DUF397 domain-containing protein [Streptomyces sp. GQFP]|uniref:DUF397 domain-containing protein n=1 Tax=Streptomyces sp. GQFP TaxID=2907545 RepID=UPI001F296FD2|nr:DUF397 domain-containing protein [Streptomyces sp. GQFP]UIX32804.1 DUF397 domain-containing protein [Streptomyces sp. GQFP]
MSTRRDAREPALEAAWFKSSYSSDAGGSCVEIAPLASAHVAVRDSKVPSGPVLMLPLTAFAALTAYMKGTDR